MELKKYIKSQVMDKSYSIMSIEELETITHTYVLPLRENLHDLKVNIKEYEKAVTIVFSKADEVFQIIDDALKVFKTAQNTNSGRNSSALLAVPGMATSAVLAIVAREVAVKVIGGIIVSSTVIGVAISLYAVYSAKKGIEKKLAKIKREKLLEQNTIKIDGGDMNMKANVDVLGEAMSFFEDFGKKVEEKKSKIAIVSDNENKLDELLNIFEGFLIRKLEAENKEQEEKEEDLKRLVEILEEAEDYSMKVREIL